MSHSQVEINAYLLNEIHAAEDGVKKDILKDILDIVNGGERPKKINPIDYLFDLMWQYKRRYNPNKDEMLIIIGIKHWEKLMARYPTMSPAAWQYPYSILEQMPSGNWYFGGYRVCIEWKYQYAIDFVKIDESQLYEDAVAFEHRKSFARFIQDYNRRYNNGDIGN